MLHIGLICNFDIHADIIIFFVFIETITAENNILTFECSAPSLLSLSCREEFDEGGVSDGDDREPADGGREEKPLEEEI